MIVLQWTEEQIKMKTADLQEAIDAYADVEGVRAALCKLLFHDADKAEIFSHVQWHKSHAPECHVSVVEYRYTKDAKEDNWYTREQQREVLVEERYNVIVKMIMLEVNQLTPVVLGPVLMTMVQQRGWLLKYVAEDMKGDRELCMAAVAQDWRAHNYASKEVQQEREIKETVMKAIKQNWRSLQEASEEMKGDRELCMAAVAQDGEALQYASEEMKGDRELCTAAVTQTWGAFEYVRPELKNDEAVVIAALECELKGSSDDRGKPENLWVWSKPWGIPEAMKQNNRVREVAGVR